MKVLWWTGEYPPDVGGIATVAQQTLAALAARGINAHALIAARGDEDGVDGAIPLTRRPIAESLIDSDAAAFAQWIAFVRNFKDHQRADVYHVHPADPSVLAHLMTLSAHPAPTIVTFHQQMFSVLPAAAPQSLIGRLIAQAQIVTAVSAASANQAVATLPEIADKLIVIPNGLQVSGPVLPLPSAPRIVAVGRLVPVKGFHDLIRAMVTVVEQVPDAHLHIVGDGPERGALEQMCERLGLTTSITFTGAVGQDQVRALMDASTIVAMPSTVEGMPMVALEASERGRAIVGSNIGGINEVVLDGVSGVLIDRNDDFIDTFARMLTDLLTDLQRAEALGLAARARLEDRQSVDRVAALYEIAYRAVCNDRPAPLVSVIMPAHNGEAFIRQAVESVLEQGLADLELIIVDDGSTDATLRVLAHVSDPRLIVLPQPNRGSGSARNAGIAIARGQYIAHIDHDDLWPPDRLACLWQVLDADPEMDACFGTAIEFADPSMRGNYAVRSEPMTTRFPTTGLIRAAFHRSVGPFHSEPFGDQVDWSIRALDAGMRYAELANIVLRRRIHDSNMSHRNPLDKDMNKLRLLKRSLDQRKGDEDRA